MVVAHLSAVTLMFCCVHTQQLVVESCNLRTNTTNTIACIMLPCSMTQLTVCV